MRCIDIDTRIFYDVEAIKGHVTAINANLVKHLGMHLKNQLS